MIEKQSVDKLIILNSAVALPAGGSRLFDPATGADVLAMNGVGVFESVAGSGSPKATTATTAATAQYIEIIKRRDTTGDKSPLPPRHYERSGLISLNCISGLEYSGATAETGTSQSYVIGAPHGVVGAVTPLDDTAYTMVIVADGAKTDKLYGSYTQPTLSVTKKFADFGVSPGLTGFTSTQEVRDYILSSIVDRHNVLSSGQGDTMSIAVAVATLKSSVSELNGATSYNATALGNLTVGDYLTIGYNHDNSAVRMMITSDNKAALIAIVAAANAKSGQTTAAIVQYALPTALNVAAMTAAKTAGGQGLNEERIDMMGFVTVDIEDAFYSETFSGKRRITIGLDPDSGFDSSVFVQEASVPKAGTGYGVDIKQWYKNVEHYKQYTSSKDYGAMHIAYPDDIVTSGFYDVYSLYYCSNRSSNGGTPVTSPKRVIVAIPNFTVGDSASNSFYTGSANPQKGAFQTIMTAFVNRVGLPAVAL
jgi:hypothetical protein